MIPRGAIVFISQPPPQVNAVYGGLMTLRAQALGAAGVVIDGRVRDLGEHRTLKFPVCFFYMTVCISTNTGSYLPNPLEQQLAGRSVARPR